MQGQGREGADQAGRGQQVDADHFIPGLRVDLGGWRQHAGLAGIRQQDVELAPTFLDDGAELFDTVARQQIERDQGRGAARGADQIIDFLQRTGRARRGDYMRAGLAEFERHGAANTTRSTGHQGDEASQVNCGHASTNRESWNSFADSERSL